MKRRHNPTPGATMDGKTQGPPATSASLNHNAEESDPVADGGVTVTHLEKQMRLKKKVKKWCPNRIKRLPSWPKYGKTMAEFQAELTAKFVDGAATPTWNVEIKTYPSHRCGPITVFTPIFAQGSGTTDNVRNVAREMWVDANKTVWRKCEIQLLPSFLQFPGPHPDFFIAFEEIVCGCVNPKWRAVLKCGGRTDYERITKGILGSVRPVEAEMRVQVLKTVWRKAEIQRLESFDDEGSPKEFFIAFEELFVLCEKPTWKALKRGNHTDYERVHQECKASVKEVEGEMQAKATKTVWKKDQIQALDSYDFEGPPKHFFLVFEELFVQCEKPTWMAVKRGRQTDKMETVYKRIPHGSKDSYTQQGPSKGKTATAGTEVSSARGKRNRDE